MKLNYHPDRSSYYELDQDDYKEGPILFRVNDYSDLFKLGQFTDAYFNYFKVKPNIFIPNLIDAQADKRESSNKSFGLKLVIKFLKDLPVNKFYIFHPHNPYPIIMGLSNVEIISNSYFINKVLSDLYDTGKEYTLMSSDAGGFKPLIELCNDINWKGETLSCSKSRVTDSEGNTKFVQRLPLNDFEGRNIIIVDDLAGYGGTFKGLSKLLNEANCGELNLAVSHLTVRHLGNDPVTNYFNKVYSTNSKFPSYSKNSYCDSPLDNLVIFDSFSSLSKDFYKD